MRRRELVTLTRLPGQRAGFAETARANGYDVQDSGTSLVLTSDYFPSRFAALSAALAKSGLQARVRRSVTAEYEPRDWSTAPLMLIEAPEVELSVEGSNDRDCPECGQQSRGQAPRPLFRKITWKEDLISVAGMGLAVSAAVKDALETHGIRGATFTRCDRAALAYWLGALRELTRPTFDQADTLGTLRLCGTCDAVVEGMAFGPTHFRRQDWNGEDVVYSRFHQAPVVSPTVLKVLRTLEPRVSVCEPVLLD